MHRSKIDDSYLNDRILKLPLPPPLAIETINDEDIQQVKGIMKRNDEGSWVKRFLTFRKLGGFLVDIYDNWLENRLKDQLENIAIEFDKEVGGGKLCYTNLYIERPKKLISKQARCSYGQQDISNHEALTPWEAKRNNLTYAVSIYAIPSYVDAKGNVTHLYNTYCHIGNIPLMLGSKYCYFSDMSSAQIINVGEDPDTCRGYFIVKGRKKVVVNFEKVRLNKPLLYRRSTAGVSEIICRVTFENYTGTSIVELSPNKSNVIEISLSSLNFYEARRLKKSKRLDKKDKKINIFFVFFYLLKDEQLSHRDILETYVLCFVKEQHRARVIAELASTVVKHVEYPEEFSDPVIFFAKKISFEDVMSKDVYEQIIEEIDRVFDRDLFPNLNNLQQEIKQQYKAYNLGFMVARVAEYMAGVRQLDNRDFWYNKRLESAGRLMEQYFRILWGHLLKKALEDEMKKVNANNKSTIDMQAAWLLREYLCKGNVNHVTLAKSIADKVRYNLVTESFENAFIVAWQIKGVYRKENVVQDLKTDNKLAVLSHLLRLDIEGSHRGTSSQEIRHMQPDQYGFICSVHTPEGGPCGLVKNAAVTASISIGLTNVEETLLIQELTAMYKFEDTWMLRRNSNGEEYINKNNKLIRPPVTLRPFADRPGRFILNGRFLGWCKPAILYKQLYQMKLGRILLTHECSISRDEDDNVYLFTDNSRVIRPLLLLNERGDKLVYRELQEREPYRTFSFADLLANKGATYVDPQEQNYIKLASTEARIKERQEEIDTAKTDYEAALTKLEKIRSAGTATRKELRILDLEVARLKRKYKRLSKTRVYTHCELHPQALLGVSASIIPLIQTNQAARSTFQAGMATQALSIYLSNQRGQLDGKSKLLAFPSNPIVTTELEKVLGVERTPQGKTLIMLFSSHDGMTGEDAFVMNKRSVDFGVFTIIKRMPYTAIISPKGGNSYDELRLPHEFKSEKERKYYHAINPNGLPTINAHLKSGDVVISSFRIDNITKKAVDTSISLGVLEEGRVETVSNVERPDGTRIIRVVLINVRKPKVGDKFATRNAQKATISRIIDTADMPFSANGLVPDIIVNPHSIPGRMTMSYMLEILTGKVAALLGERINATPYEEIDIDKFFKLLHMLGYNQDGTEILYSGTTGEPMEIPMFIGPAYFQALKHHVDDKYQARGKRGGIKALTHQPTEGRSKQGGLRFGEMERDAVLAHGSAFFLRERLRDLSDAFNTPACVKCGSLAYPKTLQDQVVCPNCGCDADDESFGQLTIPFAFSLVRHMLAGLNIELKFKFAGYGNINSSMQEDLSREDIEDIEDKIMLPGDENEDWDEDEIEVEYGEIEEDLGDY